MPLQHSTGAGPGRAPRSRSLPLFFPLVLALSVPFWLVGALTGLQLLLGAPVSALAAFTPAVAALLCVRREDGAAGMRALLGRSLDYGRTASKLWYLPVVLLMPAIMAAAYGVMIWMGTPVPAPRVPILATFALFLALLATGLGEELGWSGYATDPLQERWGALGASILLGLFWVAWHIVPLLQAGRAPAWIAWWSLGTVGLRVLTVWLYNNTGRSVFAAALFHAMGNVSWQLFPVHGSYYDPRVVAPIVAIVAAFVALAWGPQTLGSQSKR